MVKETALLNEQSANGIWVALPQNTLRSDSEKRRCGSVSTRGYNLP